MNSTLSYARSADGTSIAFNVIKSHKVDAQRMVIVADVTLGAYQVEQNSPAVHHFLDSLQEHFDILLLDPRGMGFSGGSPSTLPLSEAPDEIATVTEHLGWDRYALLGVVIDGPRAIAHAAAHPERVSKLALWCSPVATSRILDTPRGQALVDLSLRDRDLFIDTLAHALVGWDTPEEARVLARRLRSGMASVLEMMQYVAAADAEYAVDSIKVPTIVLFRRRLDEVLTLDMARELVERIPDARLALIEGSSLAPYAEPVAPVLHVIREFFGIRAKEDEERTRQALETLDQAITELTTRQIEVLRLLAGGMTNREIAGDLSISVHTVDRHISQIYRRIGARGRADATGYAIRNALVE